MLGKYLDAPFFITSQKDEKFGEIVVLVTEYTDKKNLEDIFHNVLPKYWQPKKIVVVPELPRTETGKPKRTIL
jgi:O-succinylbenzoic acid--CoA ligase